MAVFEDHRVTLFRAQGYVLVPGFLDASERAELRRVCDGALDRARERSPTLGHSTPHIPLTDAGYFRDAPGGPEQIADFVASARVCGLLRGLAHDREDAVPRLKDIGYYHEQTQYDWDGDWHRDCQFGRHDPAAERQVALTTTSVRVRVALLDDDRLEIVPGTHARWDTPDELRIRRGADRATSAMPGAVRLALRAGDALVFHAWSVHRATYRRAPLRRTLDALYAFGRPPRAPWAQLNG